MATSTQFAGRFLSGVTEIGRMYTPMNNVVGTLLALALATAGQSAVKPNLSGEWKINLSKSDFGMLPPPASMSRTIAHAEPAITIVEQQRSDMGDQNSTRKYVTDGTETSFEVGGALVKSSAAWTDDTLVVVSKVDAIGATFNDKMSLSADGKTLTSRVHITSPQGEVDLTVVFDRQ
jgi:hypothetical protein